MTIPRIPSGAQSTTNLSEPIAKPATDAKAAPFSAPVADSVVIHLDPRPVQSSEARRKFLKSLVESKLKDPRHPFSAIAEERKEMVAKIIEELVGPG